MPTRRIVLTPGLLVSSVLLILALLVLGACASETTDEALPAEPPSAEAAAELEPSGRGIDPLAAELLAVQATLPACPEPPVDCGSGPETNCDNYPFVPTACQPTANGPARADVVAGPTNFLYCSGGTYALCFDSGPPQPTGTNPDQNHALPCVVEIGENGVPVANCTCQAYTSGAYFVDIYSILNRGVYLQTINQCGADGSDCPNLATCGEDGSGCAGQQEAPVCGFLAGQRADDNASSFFPGADLISAFSFAMEDQYPIGSTACQGRYAGCMTAPCYSSAGGTDEIADGDLVQCSCPLFDGDFQVGQDPPRQCQPQGAPGDSQTYVWSASNSVLPSIGKS